MIRNAAFGLAIFLPMIACKATGGGGSKTELRSQQDSAKEFIAVTNVNFKLRKLKDKLHPLDQDEVKYIDVDKMLYVKRVSADEGSPPIFVSPRIEVDGKYLAFGVDRYNSAEKILTTICKSYDQRWPYFNEVDYEGKGKTKPDIFGNWTFNKEQLVLALGGEDKNAPLILTVDEPYSDGQKTAEIRQAIISFSCGKDKKDNFR